METNVQAEAQINTKADATENVSQSPAPVTQEADKPKVESTEVKTDSVVKDDQSKPEGEKKVEDVVYDLKLPKDSALDSVALEEISQYAKEKGYTQEQAQELVNRENDAVLDYQQRQNEALAAKKKEWYDQVISDKEIGGESFNQNIEYAHRVLQKYMPKEIIEFLDKSGLGNHPELVKGFVRIGKAMQPDKLLKGLTAASSSVSLEEKFYGASIKK